MHGLAGGNLALQARGDFGEIGFARIFQVGPLLQIARILRRLAVDHAADARRRRRKTSGSFATKPSSSFFMGSVYLSNSATCPAILAACSTVNGS